MDRNPNEEDGPLSAEQLEREGWHEGETVLDEEDAPGHSLPASEDDPAGWDEEAPAVPAALTIPSSD